MAQKRGISPVIATMLLISIALLLAVIIFLWAKAFLNERIQKDLGGGPEPIESFCKDVNIAAEGFTMSRNDPPCYETAGSTPEAGMKAGCSYVRVVNRGNIPVHGLEIREKETNAVRSVGTFSKKPATGASNPTRTIRIGEDATLVIFPEPTHQEESPLVSQAKLLVVPIILGEKGTQYEAHVCDTEFAIEVPVKSI